MSKWGKIFYIGQAFKPHRKRNEQNWAETYLLTCSPDADENQPAHPHSLIGLRCPQDKTLHAWLPKMRSLKILVRLCECAVWSASSLCALVRRYTSWRCVWLEYSLARKEFSSLAFQTALGEESDQTVRMRRLICIFAESICQNVCFLTLRHIHVHFLSDVMTRATPCENVLWEHTTYARKSLQSVYGFFLSFEIFCSAQCGVCID